MITLTTDFGNKDHYVATIKGILYKNDINLKIVDISHDIPTGNIMSAAYIISTILPFYPPNTFHIVDVGSFETNQSKYIFFNYKDQFIFCPDNGIFTLINETSNPKPFLLDIEENTYPTFTLLNHIDQILDLYKHTNLALAPYQPFEQYQEKNWLTPTYTDDHIIGHIIHFDNYGNLHTNIEKAEFDKVANDRNFTIIVKGSKINKVNDNFIDSTSGEEIYFFGFNGFLQLGMKNSNAGHYMGIQQTENITIIFK